MSVPGVALLSVWRELLLLEALSLFVTDSIIPATVSGTLIPSSIANEVTAVALTATSAASIMLKDLRGTNLNTLLS